MERTILVSVKFKKESLQVEESIEELTKLAQTAGADVVQTLVQFRERPDSKFYIGKGKAEELKSLCETHEAELVIFDNDISPSHAKSLETFLDVKVINRTELILDIFAQHAKTHEGKLQVALAQAKYRLTHLVGHGEELSRLGGGIGTRGPGETKLEIDRRRIKNTVEKLEKDLERVKKSRDVTSQMRRRSNTPAISIIGYTNAGKSTLMNAIAKTALLTENKLFATLDPVTKRIFLPSGRIALLTDTVGFIKDLPHTLVSAFSSTLEESVSADILVHVVDGSSPYAEDQIASVYKVLQELQISSKSIITVFNKADLIIDNTMISELKERYSPSIFISALKKEHLDQLIELIDQQLLQSAQPSS